jgi:hypothetical protein
MKKCLPADGQIQLFRHSLWIWPVNHHGDIANNRPCSGMDFSQINGSLAVAIANVPPKCALNLMCNSQGIPHGKESPVFHAHP